MSVDAGISCGTGELFILLKRNVSSRLRMPVSFCQAIINDVNCPATLATSNIIILRLNVSMKKSFGVKGLDPSNLETMSVLHAYHLFG